MHQPAMLLNAPSLTESRKQAILSIMKQDIYTVAALYCFAPLPHYRELQAALLDLCKSRGVKGTLLLAHEGINGTIAGSADAIKDVVDFITTQPELTTPELKYSTAAEMPFHRMKVRLKREIVTMGVENIDPRHMAGTYVTPTEWNDLIQDEGTIVIDTRNDYECAIGSFNGAVDPNIKTFRDFPQWLKDHEQKLRKAKKIAMFCTGGIRCEKSTAYARSLGFDEVYHLQGGILKYLETVPPEQSLWAGECFVFDERVSVGHGLKQGDLNLCRACRRPLSAQDRLHPHFEEGVACATCHDERSEADRARYRQRHTQIALAHSQGRTHIGS